MIICSYFLFIILSGYSLAAFFPRQSPLLNLSLAPALGVLLPSTLIYFFNLFKIPIIQLFLILSWFPLGLFSIYYKRRDISQLIRKLQRFYSQENYLSKIMLFVAFLACFGLLAR